MTRSISKYKGWDEISQCTKQEIIMITMIIIIIIMIIIIKIIIIIIIIIINSTESPLLRNDDGSEANSFSPSLVLVCNAQTSL